MEGKMDLNNSTLKKKSKPGFHISDNLFAGMLILPVFAILLTVVFLPIMKGIYVSFCDYKISNLNAPVWNNFKNYINVFKDFEILIYFKNTFIYVFFTVGIQFVLGLSIALLLNMNIKGRGIYRGLFLIPWIIPSVVVAIVWTWMLQQQFGVINFILYNLGITSTVNISWNQVPILAMSSVIMAAVWRQLPYMMVMILAGLQSVDISLIESAKIEGANAWKTLKHIILPSIRPVITTAVWISIMQNFQMFTIVYNMTGGGPVDATTTLSLAAHKKAFLEYDFGAGSTIGVLWLAVLFIATLIYNKINEKYVTDYQ
jgi:ABC-type sugar transport systems, permease components